MIGDLATGNTLRCPGSNVCTEDDALVDSSFDSAEDSQEATTVLCEKSKNGYCLSSNFAADGANSTANALTPPGFDDYGWMASMVSFNKSGRRDFSVYGDNQVCYKWTGSRRNRSNC